MLCAELTTWYAQLLVERVRIRVRGPGLPVRVVDQTRLLPSDSSMGSYWKSIMEKGRWNCNFQLLAVFIIHDS